MDVSRSVRRRAGFAGQLTAQNAGTVAIAAIQLGPKRHGQSLFRAISITMALAGCAHTQLNSNTLDVASTIQSLYREQALLNLSQFIDDPNTIPSQVDISGGTVETQDGVTSSLNLPLGNQVVRNGSTLVVQTIQENVRALMLGANGSWRQNWSITPVTDANALRRLRALYRFAIHHEKCSDECAKKKLKDEYMININRSINNEHIVVDVNRMLEPQCVVCINDDIISQKLDGNKKNEIGSSSKSELAVPTNLNLKPLKETAKDGAEHSGAKLSQQRSSGDFSKTSDNDNQIVMDTSLRFHISKYLHAGWLYWKSDSVEPSLKETPPAPCQNTKGEQLPDCREHSLGHYGHHELLMTETDYQAGVLSDFLLFLLPQADPRLPAPPAAGGSGGGGKGAGS
jgi:hypothetical protein